MFYERKIKYLDYYENGERIKGSGFVKLEARDGGLRIEVAITGLHVTDSFTRDVLLCCDKQEIVIGRIRISGGKGQYRQSCQGMNEIGGMGITYGQLQGIRIPLGGDRELSCNWQEKSREEIRSGEQNGGSGESRTRKEMVVRSAGTAGSEDLERNLEKNESGADGIWKVEIAGKLTGSGAESVQSSGRSAGFKLDSKQSKAGNGGSEREDTRESVEYAGIRAENEESLLRGTGSGEGTVGRFGSGAAQRSVGYAGTQGETARSSVLGYESGAEEARLGAKNRGKDSERQEDRRQEPSGKDQGIRAKQETSGGEEGQVWRKEKIGDKRSGEPEGRAEGPEKYHEEAREGEIESAEQRCDSKRRGAQETKHPVKLLEDKWLQLCAIYPHINPFHDKREYLSIGPSDFVLFPSAAYKMVNNSFLLHGYYNYHHLILTRLEKKGEKVYYIGVPGNYYEKEKQVAIMFGFESFECEEEPAQTGDFGYYMMRTEL